MAQQWSDRCVDEYGNVPFNSADFDGSDVLGQNNWVGGGEASGGLDLAAVVNDWASQSRHYDYDRNRCSPGKTCSDYTQVIQQMNHMIISLTLPSYFGYYELSGDITLMTLNDLEI